MANTKVITAQYIDFIADKVIDKFGGSYQNVQTLGKTWRQQMPYSSNTEEFILQQSNMFLRLLDVRDQGNFNMMYKVCYNIADYVSKYIVRKSPELTRKVVTDKVLNDIFFNSERFVTKFNKAYKRPIDMNNTGYVAANPGVIAMYRAINAKQM